MYNYITLKSNLNQTELAHLIFLHDPIIKDNVLLFNKYNSNRVESDYNSLVGSLSYTTKAHPYNYKKIKN